jgi:probable HAF family extracellular repeat protein
MKVYRGLQPFSENSAMRAQRSSRWLSVFTACALAFTPTLTEAKKPEKPGGGGGGSDGGGETAAYDYVDLLGFDNGNLGYQSAAKYVLNRDENGDVMILGDSYQRYQDLNGDLEYQENPAMWYVLSDGTFSEPLDLGTPASIRHAEPEGFNAFGEMVVRTGRAAEQYDNGDYVFPSFVKNVLGTGYQELPAFVGRDSTAYSINSLGTIVGYQNISDPDAPGGIRSVGCIWQLDGQGVPSEPISLGDFLANDINDFGVMAGSFRTVVAPESVRYTPAIAWFEGEELVVEEMSTTDPIFDSPRVEALNDRPVGDPLVTIVGETNEPNGGQAYGWRPFDLSQPVTLIGTFSGGTVSRATDVNAGGEIVGYSETGRDGPHAFIYAAGVLFDLNDLTDAGKNTLRWANGINDDGDIVGHMRVPRPVSEQRGFLLKRATSK